MRALMTTAILAVLSCGGTAMAAPAQSQVSPGDYVNAIKAAPAPNDASASPSTSTACPQGQTSDDDGICQPMADTRGFSLVRPHKTASAIDASSPAASGQVSAGRTAHYAMHSAPASASSALADLHIGFSRGSSEMTDQDRANARSFAAGLRNPAVLSTRFEIAGHTDSTGSADANMTLSQSRAEAVRAYLVSQGVDASRLVAKGYGSTDPATPSDPTAAINRRVEARRMN